MTAKDDDLIEGIEYAQYRNYIARSNCRCLTDEERNQVSEMLRRIGVRVTDADAITNRACDKGGLKNERK